MTLKGNVIITVPSLSCIVTENVPAKSVYAGFIAIDVPVNVIQEAAGDIDWIVISGVGFVVLGNR